MSQVTALILAAGEGKRMKSEKAKVIHRLCGRAMIEWVYEAARGAGIERCAAIVGHKADQIMECMGNKVEYVLQENQLGTGHALQQAHHFFNSGEGTILVLYGDTPLISSKTITNAIEYMKQGEYKAVVISADVQEPFGYGRIIRDAGGSFLKIVEQRDTNEDEKAVREINSGMYVFSAKELAEALKLLTNNNEQKEYYLTDTLEIMLSKGYKTGIYKAADSDEVLGVNDRVQLQQVSSILKKRIMTAFMLSGVTIVDPGFTHIDADVEIGADTVILPGSVIEGITKIGRNCTIGPNSTVKNAIIGEGSTVFCSIIDGCTIDDGAEIGPGARICK
jgi:bifunctional UDP-N-acetylglucosamine pyrophosphorylase / glucosamine-1-phosphate N-acetyltransferase